jgi:hypothetical protein
LRGGERRVYQEATKGWGIGAMNFEMNRTWSQAISLVQANFQLLAIIAGIFMLVPALVFYFAIPDVLSMSAFGADPDATAERMNAMMPRLIGLGALVLLLQWVGYTAMIALMGEDRPTVAEAIGRGFKALPTLIGTFLLFLLASLLFMLLFSLVVGVLAAVSGGGEGAVLAFVAVLYVFFLVFFLFVFARLSVTLPVIVLDREFNPWTALVRSWRLTKPRAWAIVGFFFLLFIAYMVLSMILMMVVSGLGLAAGEAVAGASLVILALLYGAVGMAAAMLLSGILVSMHGQLSGTSSSEIGRTFE